MYNPAIAIQMLTMIVQYFMLLKVLTEFSESNLFCLIDPTSLNALYNATKNAIEDAYPYKINGSRYILNRSKFCALPSVSGNRIMMKSATIPISTMTA